MNKALSLLLVSIFLLSSQVFAGFGYDTPYQYDSVIAPVNIEEEGIYNLVISVQFMNEPYDKKVYDSDEYNLMLSRLSVEWSKVAIDSVLNSKVSKLQDLAVLKVTIENGIEELVNSLKMKYGVKKEVEVVFSISNFYLLDSKKQ